VVASDTDSAGAQALFDAAKKLIAKGQYQAACPKLEESYRIDPGIGTLLNLADCWEHLGRTASAWARFREAAGTARRSGQKDREKFANTRANALEPKLSYLVVEVKAGATTHVMKDGASIGVAQWGTRLPVDPGPHSVEAKAPAKRPWQQTIEVPADGKTISVTVPLLEDEPVRVDSAPAVVPAVSKTAVPASHSPAQADAFRDAEPSSSSSNVTRTIGWTVGGIGVVGLAIGGFFSWKTYTKNADADAVCPSASQCTETDHVNYENAIADARSARTIAIVGFAAGGAALVAGSLLVLTSSRSPTAGIRIAPSMAAGAPGLNVQGTW
jgi:serine/threonine-protein kinase